MLDVNSDFIGAGWAFPVTTDATGSIALVRKTQEVEQAMHLILATSPGERPMRPEFGCGIQNYVFAPVDATTAGRVALEVRTALERWEPRITVVDVAVTPADGSQSTLYIDISYSLRGTNDRRNLVFPFYVIPEEGS